MRTAGKPAVFFRGERRGGLVRSVRFEALSQASEGWIVACRA